MFIDSKLAKPILNPEVIQTLSKTSVKVIDSAYLRNYIFNTGNVDEKPFNLLLPTEKTSKKK